MVERKEQEQSSACSSRRQKCVALRSRAIISLREQLLRGLLLLEVQKVLALQQLQQEQGRWALQPNPLRRSQTQAGQRGRHLRRAPSPFGWRPTVSGTQTQVPASPNSESTAAQSCQITDERVSSRHETGRRRERLTLSVRQLL
jgi:hypothetical protein